MTCSINYRPSCQPSHLAVGLDVQSDQPQMPGARPVAWFHKLGRCLHSGGVGHVDRELHSFFFPGFSGHLNLTKSEQRFMRLTFF